MKGGVARKEYDSDKIGWLPTDEKYLKATKFDIKNTHEYCEAFSANLCKVCIEKCFGIRLSAFYSVRDIVMSNDAKEIFERPFLIRCRYEYTYNISWPFTVGTKDKITGKKGSNETMKKSKEERMRGVDKEEKMTTLTIRKIEACVDAPGQKEALNQIQLINYFIFAEEQVIVMLEGLIYTRTSEPNILSRAEDLKRQFSNNKKSFYKLLFIITEKCRTLSSKELREADELVDKHNRDWEELERLTAEAEKTNPVLKIQDMSDEEVQNAGKSQMDILFYLVTYEEKAIEFLEGIEELVPQEKLKQYNDVRKRMGDQYVSVNNVINEMIKNTEMLDERRTLDAEKLSTKHKVLWIAFENFVLEMAKYQV